jgi:hypothetical protein
VADFAGIFKRPMKGLDGQQIQPTSKKFKFCIVTTWKKCKITEERFFMI